MHFLFFERNRNKYSFFFLHRKLMVNTCDCRKEIDWIWRISLDRWDNVNFFHSLLIGCEPKLKEIVGISGVCCEGKFTLFFNSSSCKRTWNHWCRISWRFPIFFHQTFPLMNCLLLQQHTRFGSNISVHDNTVLPSCLAPSARSFLFYRTRTPLFCSRRNIPQPRPNDLL